MRNVLHLVAILALVSGSTLAAVPSRIPSLQVAVSGWTVEPVAYFGGSSPPRLALDSAGIPHVFYCPPGDEEYATRMPSGWSSEHVVSTDFGGGCGDLAMGRDDVPRVTTGVAPIGSPCEEYGIRANGMWAFECFPGGVLDAVDSLGRPHAVTYWTIAPNRYDLRHLWRDANGTWEYETAEANAIAAFPVLRWYSLAVDTNDRPHILYYDSVRGDVRYTFKDASGWHVEVVDHVGDIQYIGKHGSLALARDGTPSAAYLTNVSFAMNRASLRYALRVAGVWQVRTVDGPPGMKGFFPTILTTHADLPRIGYQDWGQTGADLDLRYASFEGTTWTFETVYDAPLLGVQFPTFRLDACDQPQVAFYSNDERAVMYAMKGGPCNVRSVSLRLEPRTLNLKSHGQWITAQITVENATSGEIDPASLRLNGVPVAWSTVLWNHTIMGKFDRTAFAATVAPGDSVTVTLTGKWRDGGTFTATDTIRVIRPGK